MRCVHLVVHLKQECSTCVTVRMGGPEVWTLSGALEVGIFIMFFLFFILFLKVIFRMLKPMVPIEMSFVESFGEGIFTSYKSSTRIS